MPLKIDRRTKCAEQRADDCAEQQHQHHDDHARRPGAHGRVGQQAAEVRLDEVGEVPGEEQRHDPGAERDRLAQEAAHRTDDGRDENGGNNQIVRQGHRSWS